MRVVRSLAPWAPWIVFLIVAQGSLVRLGIGLAAALLVGSVLAVLKLFRGILMWMALCFFAGALVAVFGFHSHWVLTHLGLIANAMLAAGAWFSLLAGRPFTLVYARDDVDPALWEDPVFLRVNRVITTVWALAFTVNAGIECVPAGRTLPLAVGTSLTVVVLAAAVWFSAWYPRRFVRGSAHAHG